MKTNVSYFLNSNSILSVAYSKLIAIEIALRTIEPIFCHDVPAKLNNFGRGKNKHNIYAVHSVNISNVLSSIPINTKQPKNTPRGTPWAEYTGWIPPYSYPYIRYVRLSTDYPSASIDDSVLIRLNAELDRVIVDLRIDGVVI